MFFAGTRGNLSNFFIEELAVITDFVKGYFEQKAGLHPCADAGTKAHVPETT